MLNNTSRIVLTMQPKQCRIERKDAAKVWLKEKNLGDLKGGSLAQMMQYRKELDEQRKAILGGKGEQHDDSKKKRKKKKKNQPESLSIFSLP